MLPEKAKAIEIGGIPVDLYREEDYNTLLDEAVRENKKKLFFNTNAHLVVLANRKAPWLKSLFKEKVDYVMCDGAGVQLAARLLGKPVPEKVAYNVWFWDYARYCAEKGYRIFFLGAKKEVIEKAKQRMIDHSPGLQIESHHGYFDKKKGSPENEEIIQRINEFNPQVILVGFGMPAQEKWIVDNMDDINANAFFPCGGAFDFFSGNASLAPEWLRNLKLEWLYRMLREPLRLGKRYLVENPLFLYYVFRNR